MTPASHETKVPTDPAMLWLRTLEQQVRAHLEQRRLALADEMRNYPSPIPGCDQQFNWLLDQHHRVRRQLQELDALCSSAAGVEDLAAKLRAFDPEGLPEEAYPHDTVHSSHH